MARYLVSPGTIDACHYCGNKVMYRYRHWYNKFTGEEVEYNDAWHNMKRDERAQRYVEVHAGWFHTKPSPISDEARYCPDPERPVENPIFQRRVIAASYCHDCGRKQKGTARNGLPVCGIHLRAEREEQKRNEEWEQHHDVQSWISREVTRKIQLLRRYGLEDVKEHYQSTPGAKFYGHYTGKIIVNPDELIELLESAIELLDEGEVSNAEEEAEA